MRPVEQPHSSLQHCACIGGVSSSITTTRATTTALSAKLWRRLEIEEDEEPMWYLLNCIAGLELDLLRQCRQKCADMPDALKFVVPIEKSTRSHGPNRIVTDVKVRYQGYVFGKLRLCEEVYEAVQELDLCRSWMGTVNKKGHQKLPPAPVALNEMEIENFGLEDLEEGMEDANDVTAVEEVLNEEGVILDTEETDQKILKKELKKKRNPKVDEEQLKEYMELRVDDMIKVTANNKFKGEDGIVKRLKNAQVMVRFFTYGSTYDEWLDPKDVRKMSNEEVMRGLSGPTAPVTQDDLEGGARDKWSNRSGPGGLRDALMSSAGGGGGQRNTRQDRNQQKFRQKDMFGRSDDERKNWNWYQNERRGSSRGGARDGDTEIGVGSQQAQGDVDAQWGRFSKRQQRRDNPRDDNRGQDRRNNRGQQPPPRNMRTNQNIANAIDGEDDWSSFVSSPGAPKEQSKSNDADDDFFNSLMSELNAEDESSGGGGQTSSGSSSSNEDDDSFFSSLMSELNEVDEDKQQPQPQQQQRPPPTKQDKSKSEDYDFFAALEAELADEPSPTKAISSADDADDFFAKLEAEMKDAPKVAEEDSSAAGGGDDFFANLEKELSDPAFEGDVGAGAPTKAAAPADPDDFFSQLETELSESPQEKKQPAAVSNDDPDDFFAQLETELSEPIAVVAAEKEPAAKKPAAAAAPSTGDTGSLSKKKVPELKDMLRERGLKVSGKKAELIERLMQ